VAAQYITRPKGWEKVRWEAEKLKVKL
jgi:hypothetical protein